MSGVRNRRGRPRRNNVTALKQQHSNEKTLTSDTAFDLDASEPLTIVQLAKQSSSMTLSTSLPPQLPLSSSSSLADAADKELPATVKAEAAERDSTQYSLKYDAITAPLSSSESAATTTDALESSELSSEDDDAVNTATSSALLPSPPAPLLAGRKAVNTSQGVDLDQLPKVQFVKGSTQDDFFHDDDEEEEEEEKIYQQEQLAQEEQLLIQHYQTRQQQQQQHLLLQQQQQSPQPQQQPINSKDILHYSRSYQRPENHYVHYNEPSDVELYDTVEYDMDEQDQCWLKLYNKERRKEILGDISPYLFECIMDKLEKEWFNLIKDAPKPEPEQELLPEDSACVVCDDTEVENSNAIVFCDGCNVAVHQDCYGIPYIPEGQWLCRKCMISPEFPVSCLFCPNEGGAFKQTNTNQWGHLLCAIWIPEVGVSNTIYMEPIDQIENIPKSRWKLTCSLCRKKQGACIQCDNKHCFSAFHVTCAKAANLCMNMNSQSSQQLEGVILKAYCERHTPKEYCAERKTAGSSNSSHATVGNRNNNNSVSSGSNSSSEDDDEGFSRGGTRGRGRGRGGRGRGTSTSRGRGRGRGRPSKSVLTEQQQQHIDEANNKVARAHQHHYSTGAPIAPDIILAKIDNLPCVRLSGIRKRPQAVTAIAHYWSLKRESRRGAPLLKRLHLEPWTAYSKYKGDEDEYLIRKAVITQLRADLEKIRMLSEQVQKRERLKLEQVKKQKAYLEMIFFPLEYVIRPVLNQFMEIDRKKLFLNHVTVDEAADYCSVIAQPMCFAEIYQKLANHSYATLDHFKSDVELIWKNSMDYNTADTSFYKVASKLKAASQKLFEGAEAKMNYFGVLQDEMLQEPIDESIFSYDMSLEQQVVVQVEEHRPAKVDSEAEHQLRLEKERLKAEKQQEHRKAVQARVQGRAKARALREENKRKGILPAANGAQEKSKSNILKKLRARNHPQALKDNADTTIDVVETTQDSSTKTSSFSPPMLEEQPVRHTAEQVNDLKVEEQQWVTSPANSFISNVSSSVSAATAASNDIVDLPTENLLIEARAEEEIKSVSSLKGKEKEKGTIPAMPEKRPYPSSNRITPRLTRSNGLKASIEELTKRRKISHEARVLFASYNGVSHLDRPVEIYKENRKIHAPVGWVYVDDDDDEDDDDGEDEEEEVGGDNDKDDGMDLDEQDNREKHKQENEPESTAKPARQGRNDIPVPQFNRGEIVWARVNRYPSHPAKFLNYSDEEAGPKLVASRRYNGDILVEFLKVPEMHRFGWVGRRTICEIGDAQTDRQRLSETLHKKMKRKEYIQEAKEGYRCAGSILGLDPEPLLSEVFDRPPPEKKRKKQPHTNKKRR